MVDFPTFPAEPAIPRLQNKYNNLTTWWNVRQKVFITFLFSCRTSVADLIQSTWKPGLSSDSMPKFTRRTTTSNTAHKIMVYWPLLKALAELSLFHSGIALGLDSGGPNLGWTQDLEQTPVDSTRLFTWLKIFFDLFINTTTYFTTFWWHFVQLIAYWVMLVCQI